MFDEDDVSDDELKSWPRALIEMSVANEVWHCLHIISQSDLSNLRWYRQAREKRLASAQRFAKVLENSGFADIACAFLALRHEENELSPETLEETSRAVKQVLLQNLREAPATEHDFRDRIQALLLVPWIGGHARDIPRGWVPLFERAADLLHDHADGHESADWQTLQIKEKYGTLRWYVRGDALFAATRGATTVASDYCCIVCGTDADLDFYNDEWWLNLCDAHKRMREEAPEQLARLLYLRRADP